MVAFNNTSTPFHSTNRVSQQMLWVLITLIPGILAMTIFFGPAVFINISLAVVVALATETLILKLRHRPIRPALLDGSAVVTAVLIAISIPPLSPWWLTATGVVFALVFAKHLYGGLGHNLFNPAMIAYVFLLLSFPLEMTAWLSAESLSNHSASFFSSLQMIFTGQYQGLTIDALSGATPLDHFKTERSREVFTADILSQPIYGGLAGIGWQWINIGFLIGGLWLLVRNIISWHVPVAMLGSLLLLSALTWLLAPTQAMTPLLHLFSGGTMLCAFFIATDPVSGAASALGKLVFGAGVGLLIYLIRVWGGYPDAVAFAVIFMNMLVPLIDYYTRPRAYGENK